MFSFSSITQYRSQLESGATTCLEAVQHYLSRIREDHHLNAFIEVYAEEALQRAAWLDGQQVKKKLHGVIIGIKDNICYKGHRVTAASKILQNFIAPYSATAVDRLIAEGAIIIGRQNCDEFGMGSTNENSTYGAVLNPVDPSYVPGGSSGGSAAAVKAGLCMVSLGSDTGGSVRLPADFCGVVGFKPAYGRISRYGLIAYASSFDQIGILASNANDVAQVLQVISGPDEYDSTALPHVDHSNFTKDKSKYRIAYFPEWITHPSLDPEIASSLQKKILQLQNEGHAVTPVSFPLTDFIVPTYYILTTAEASSNLARYDGARYGFRTANKSESLQQFYKDNRTEGFGKEVKKRIMLGCFVLSSGYYEAYFTKAQQVRRVLQTQTAQIFRDFDFILAPTATSTAYPAHQSDIDPIAVYMGDIFTVFANLSGIPAISLPLFKHSSNLPFGLQVLSSPQNEVSLLRFSHQLMQQ